MCFDFGWVCVMHHCLASNLVTCDFVLYVDSESLFCRFSLFVNMIV